MRPVVMDKSEKVAKKEERVKDKHQTPSQQAAYIHNPVEREGMDAYDYALRCFIVGEPNVGKSTLFNRLVQQPYSAVSKKRHTTKEVQVGSRVKEDTLMVFYDHPGYDPNAPSPSQANAVSPDVYLYLLDSLRPVDIQPIESYMNNRASVPVCVGYTKADKMKDKEQLLYQLDQLDQLGMGQVPIHVIDYDQPKSIEGLEDALMGYRVEGKVSTHESIQPSYVQVVEEAIKQGIYQYTNQEIPHRIQQSNHSWEVLGDHAVKVVQVLEVENERQLRILIGREGKRMKAIAMRAAELCEEALGKKFIVYLNVRCRG